VLVLSREFVCKEAPMAELKMFLERWRTLLPAGKRGIVLVPVLWKLEWGDLEALDQLYAPSTWPPGVKRASKEQIEEWKSLLGELTAITCIRRDQVTARQHNDDAAG
jgi:hypothetical protein